MTVTKVTDIWVGVEKHQVYLLGSSVLPTTLAVIALVSSVTSEA